jgi:hypothetical protein
MTKQESEAIPLAAGTVLPSVTEGMAAASRLYAVVTGGQPLDAARQLKDGWLFIGMADRVLYGDPDESAGGFTSAAEAFTQEQKELLTDLHEGFVATTAEGSTPSAFGLSPALLALLMGVIQELLRKLIGG